MRITGNQILVGGLSPENNEIVERRKRRLRIAREIRLKNYKKLNDKCLQKFRMD